MPSPSTRMLTTGKKQLDVPARRRNQGENNLNFVQVLCFVLCTISIFKWLLIECLEKFSKSLEEHLQLKLCEKDFYVCFVVCCF